MKYFCYQGNEHDCGFASLKMLLALLTGNRDYLYLRKGEKKESYSFSDLVDVASQHGVTLSGWSIPFSELTNAKLPCLVLIRGNHLVLLKKMNKHYLYFYDPGKGKVKMTHTDFTKIFEEKVLVPIGVDKEIDFKEKAPRIIPIKYTFIHLLIGVVSSALLLLDFYFMKDHENISFVILFLGLFILAELVENWYIFKIIIYFDKKYIPLYFKDKKDKNLDSYQRFLSLKTSFFSSRKSAILFGSLAIVLIVILTFNDLKNLIVVAVLSTYKILELFLTQNKDQKLVRKIADGETKAFDNPRETVTDLLFINDLASQQTFRIASRKCIYTFIMFLLALLMMLLNQQISVNYAVFHFGLYFVIGQGIDALFLFVANHQENQKQYAQFIDKCDL